MSDKTAKAIQDAIEKLEAKIANLEEQLKTVRADLKHKEDILTLARNGSQGSLGFREGVGK